MEYTGKLYGKIGNKYFDTGRTSEEFDKYEKMAIELQLVKDHRLHNVSNSTLDKCIELFHKLTPTEKLIVMDRTCKNCGNEIENWVCDKCDNPC